MNSPFYLGVVESRQDPLKLGRVQVRVFGVHSESLSEVPTSALPWATSIGTSAALSGKGVSSAKFLEGTMVHVFFSDGESKQQPVILGSIPGIPLGKSPFGDTGTSISESIEELDVQQTSPIKSTVSPTANGTLLDSSGKAVTDASGEPIRTDSTNSRQKLKDALGKKESSNNYKAVNRLNYLGKYQMGAAMLTDLGYVKKGTSNSGLNNPDNWTGKDGMSSKDDFLNNPTVQESAMDAELDMNEKRLTKMGVIDDSTTEQEKSGYLSTSHLLGTGGARSMKNGIVKKDANGVTGNEYYNLGYSAVAGSTPKVAPDKTTADNPAREESTDSTVGSTSRGKVVSSVYRNLGFADPSGKYPLYVREQDTNRLARGQSIDKTIVPLKEETLDRNVPIANGQGSWSQSPNPYNAKYPFNEVHESEAGHILEIDDTPNNERIHVYHCAGSFVEIDRNGTMVRKIVGDNYEILERNGFVHIKGAVSITVDGNANISVGNNCELQVNGAMNASIGGDANWAVGGNWKVKAGGNFDISASGLVAMDGSEIHLNSDKSSADSLTNHASASTGSPALDPLALEPRNFEDLTAFEEDDLSDADSQTRQKQLQDQGLTDLNHEKPIIAEDSTSVEPSQGQELQVECGMFTPGQININEFVSPNFRLSDLTLGRQITDQAGLKDTELACNLKALAVNVLEPIKTLYPNMFITSGLRAPGKNPSSQHPLGKAADLQFRGVASSAYLEIAKTIANLGLTDQLILEYRSDKRNSSGEPTTWIHVSYSYGANRKQTFTMNNDKRISNFGELKVVS